jgi:hypothetical protein
MAQSKSEEKKTTVYPGKYKILPEVMEFCLSSDFFKEMEGVNAAHSRCYSASRSSAHPLPSFPPPPTAALLADDEGARR